MHMPKWAVQLFAEQSEDSPSWHRKPLGVCTLYIFVLLLVCWEIYIPTPGSSAAALGVAAAAMSLRGEMQEKEKVAWILLLFGFLSLELTSINKERKTNEDMQAQIRWQESQHFQRIGDDIRSGIKRVTSQGEQEFRETIGQQSKHFDATMAKEQANIDEATGGKSYVIVYPDFTPNKDNTFPLLVMVCPTCQNSVSDANIYFQENLLSLENGTLIFQGMVNPNSATESRGTITTDRAYEYTYKILVIARNKPTREVLKVRFNKEKNKWECSWHIEREEKRPHYNAITNMAEGGVVRVLEDSGWSSNSATLTDPKKTTVIH